MLKPKLRSHLFPLLGLVAVMSAGLVLLAAVRADDVARPVAGSSEDQEAQQPQTRIPATPEPPPPYNSWIDPITGRFSVPEYDDRHLSEEQKAADPVFNPRWAPFARCMEDAGYEALAPGSTRFSQRDLDLLLERVNAERPDVAANRQVKTGDQLPGLPGAFLNCADQWLALSTEEMDALGLRD
jgi:hypothetical protein